jgi:hypothetical protein
MYKVKQLNTYMNRNKINTWSNNRPVNIQNENEFPSLCDVNKIDTFTNSNKTSNYSTMVQKEVDAIDKTEEHPRVPSGYIIAKFDKNRIIIHIDSKMEEDKKRIQMIRDEEHVEKTHLSMIRRWQNERDELNELLGSQSPYWDSINLFEFDEEELNDDNYEYDCNDDDEREYFEKDDYTYNDELY